MYTIAETLSTRLQFLATIAPSQRLLQLLDYDFVAVNLPIDSADNIYHSSRFLGLKEHLGPNPEFVKCARVDKEGFLQVGSNPWVLRVDVLHLTKDELNKFKQDVCETLTRYGHVCYPSTLDKVRLLCVFAITPVLGLGLGGNPSSGIIGPLKPQYWDYLPVHV